VNLKIKFIKKYNLRIIFFDKLNFICLEKRRTGMSSLNFKFGRIISNDTVYGVVWSGIFENVRCVIKIVKLIDEKNNFKYYEVNNMEEINKEFNNKKSMNILKFNNEVNASKRLSDLKLAPKFYLAGMIKNSEYGFIINKRLNCSIKDILLKRSLNSFEKEKVKNLIDKLHTSGISHGDMKPSNIGIYLDSNNQILKCLFFDLCKIKYNSDHSTSDFSNFIERDLKTYKDHYDRNRKTSNHL